MSDTVDFVITNENWDRNFDEVRMITDQQWLLLAFDIVKLTRFNYSLSNGTFAEKLSYCVILKVDTRLWFKILLVEICHLKNLKFKNLFQ